MHHTEPARAAEAVAAAAAAGCRGASRAGPSGQGTVKTASQTTGLATLEELAVLDLETLLDTNARQTSWVVHLAWRHEEELLVLVGKTPPHESAPPAASSCQKRWLGPSQLGTFLPPYVFPHLQRRR